MQKEQTASDLQFVGTPSESILGTYAAGNDVFGEILAFDMEFAADQPNS